MSYMPVSQYRNRHPGRYRFLGELSTGFFVRGWTLLLLLGLFATGGTASAANGALEAKVKAAYLYNFTKFVDWPSLPVEAITICVVGADAVGDILNELSSRQAKGRPLKIERGRLVDFAHCQVLFIGGSEGNMADLLIRSQRGGILTVSDAADFARRGGVIGFYSEGGRIKLEINPETARAANLRISAKLMEVARIVP